MRPRGEQAQSRPGNALGRGHVEGVNRQEEVAGERGGGELEWGGPRKEAVCTDPLRLEGC